MSQALKIAGRIAVMTAALYTSTGIAHANWTGTWDSRHGELRLVQEGDRVYGDYADRGYFEGRVSQNGDRLRGTFQYVSQRSRNGYIEFNRSGDSFTGGWTWAKDGPSAAASQGNWTGSLQDQSIPALRYAVSREDYWADFWPSAKGSSLAWVNEGSEQGQPVYAGTDFDTGEWSGTFTTNYGDVRLVQIGRRVFGDYAQRGYFEGCTHNGGLTLRGTFQYNDPRSKHGFIEFRTDGDGFEGTWTWTRNGTPASDARINWRGARKLGSAPSLSYVTGERPHFADNWANISDTDRSWVLGSDYYDSCDPPEVEYDSEADW